MVQYPKVQAINRKGNLFVISGPSGVGKGTLVKYLCNVVPGAWLSISATTRPPRAGDVEGVDYFFLSDEEFDRMIDQKEFLEWAHVHKRRYGTPRSLVEEHIAAGDQVFLEIDVQGGLQVKENMPSCHLIFIEPPSMEELRKRLELRGTETPDEIDARMKVAEVELSQKMKYDIQLVNDKLPDTQAALLDFIAQQAGFDIGSETDLTE